MSLLICGVAAGLHAGYRRYMTTAYPLKYTPLVEQYAAEYGHAPSLLYAMIYTESGYDPLAMSGADARGLMQLTADTFQWAQSRSPEPEARDLEELFLPEINIRYGAYVLHLLGEQFEEPDTVLAAYNAGQGNVSRWLKDPAFSKDKKTLTDMPYQETREYVQRVRNVQRIYRTLYKIE